jgi:hypothetical protein
MTDSSMRREAIKAWAFSGAACGTILGLPFVGSALAVLVIWLFGAFWLPVLAVWGLLRTRDRGLALVASVGSVLAFAPIFTLTFGLQSREWDTVLWCTVFEPCVTLAICPLLEKGRWLRKFTNSSQ